MDRSMLDFPHVSYFKSDVLLLGVKRPILTFNVVKLCLLQRVFDDYVMLWVYGFWLQDPPINGWFTKSFFWFVCVWHLLLSSILFSTIDVVKRTSKQTRDACIPSHVIGLCLSKITWHILILHKSMGILTAMFNGFLPQEYEISHIT